MPRSRVDRYWPNAQSFNDDPEGWELTDLFGDRSLRTVHEIRCIVERTDNHWKLVEGWQSTIGRKARQSPNTVQGIVGWLIASGWLTISQWLASPSPTIRQWFASDPPMVGQLLASGWPMILRTRNYAKFHKTDVPPRLEEGFEYVFPLPILPSFLREDKNLIGYYAGNSRNGASNGNHAQSHPTEQEIEQIKLLTNGKQVK